MDSTDFWWAKFWVDMQIAIWVIGGLLVGAVIVTIYTLIKFEVDKRRAKARRTPGNKLYRKQGGPW